MTLALDTSALLGRYLSGPHRAVVLDAMAADPVWCAAALARTEALGMVDRVCDVPTDGDRLRRALRDDWERIHVVPSTSAASTAPPSSPASSRCAPSTPSTSPPPTASPGRSPSSPSTRRQIPVALALGFEVAST